MLGAEDSTDCLHLIREARQVSIRGPQETAAKLAAGARNGGPKKPLRQYEGSYFNAESTFMLDFKVHGDSLRVHIQGLPLTYYDLHHYADETFAWNCDRDEEAKRGMFPQLSDAFRKFEFACDCNGDVSEVR